MTECSLKMGWTKNMLYQVHPQEYQADMTAILGFVLKHDDSVNDRTEVSLSMFQNTSTLNSNNIVLTPLQNTSTQNSKLNWNNIVLTLLQNQGSKLNSADDVTRRLWMDEFNVPFARPGSMFRWFSPQYKSKYNESAILCQTERLSSMGWDEPSIDCEITCEEGELIHLTQGKSAARKVIWDHTRLPALPASSQRNGRHSVKAISPHLETTTPWNPCAAIMKGAI